ncbi:unnamed protein product [Parnassius apollo]|uniref:(apollo) hypothetical protein n=1 Tax=Parnassius apollo TaxID=110799 RepID=A0A8S3WUF9_PARAO|nr:unnamed protein product [Parnassius apollo]
MQFQPRFEFGIPPSKQIKLPTQQPQQFGIKPQPPQQPTGYKPQLGVAPQLGYRPNFYQGHQPTGYRPPPHLQRPQFQSTDVSMRTAPPVEPRGFRMNELYVLNENCDNTYGDTPYHDVDHMQTEDEINYCKNPAILEYNEPELPQEIKNFQIEASNQSRR